MRKIVLMPVKNEEWILKKSLICASMFADHIIVADQNSTDATPDICREFQKVIVIRNNSEEYNEGQRRQLLLNAARDFEGENFIVLLAADEILSANILGKDVFEGLVSMQKPGTGFIFQWIQLWKSEHLYRKDRSIWSNNYRPSAFIDDRRSNYNPGFAHLSVIPEKLVKDAVRNEIVKILHYHFVDFERMLAKQRWARVLEFKHDSRRANGRNFIVSLKLNNKYYDTKDEHGIKLAAVPVEWIGPYPRLEIKKSVPHWHNASVAKDIVEIGPRRLKWLDIWDYEWGQRIGDPRGPVARFYHGHQYLFSRMSRMAPSALKKVLNTVINALGG